jgi:hypothetical protein
MATDGLSAWTALSESIQRQPSQASKTKNGTQRNLRFFINKDDGILLTGL